MMCLMLMFLVQDITIVTISPEEFAQHIGEDVVIIDVRTPGEYQSGHIEHAQMIDFRDDQFKQKVEALDRDKTYLIYCASGGRSGRSLDVFKELGFKHVLDLAGGIKAWKASGRPVTQP